MHGTRLFDESSIRWHTLEGFEHIWYNILEVDEPNRIVDILFKFAANKQIVLHRHKADYRTFTIQGELRIYHADGSLKEVRPAGCYVSKTASDEPHREGGGDEPVIALFSNRNCGDVIYEVLDDDLKPIAMLGPREFKVLMDAQEK